MEALKTQQPELTISQEMELARIAIRSAISGILAQQESTKAEAFRKLPAAIELWAEVIRKNKHILEDLRDLAEIAHVSIPFGYGLIPDLDNPVIGTTKVKI